jgi:two-component system sensor histidine kinase KdpD
MARADRRANSGGGLPGGLWLAGKEAAFRRFFYPEAESIMAYQEERRPDPEELLRLVKAKERKEGRGRLKVFLGYASGVGKSFRMLDEGRRRKERGQDVVVGALQDRRGEESERILAGLEIVSPNGGLDIEALLKRRPQVCLIDELAHRNPPGSRNPQRWQDAEDLLEAGITVITALNIQHIEEWQDRIAALTGKRSSETVPESFLRAADEIVLVDATPETLRDRWNGKEESGENDSRDNMRHPERFLSEFREMALLFAAEAADRQLEDYILEQGLERNWRAQERILVCISPQTDAPKMLEAGRRIADRFHGELYALYVTPDEEWSDLSARDRALTQGHLALARSLQAQAEVKVDRDEAEAIASFARSRHITQIFVGHSRWNGWRRLFAGNALGRLLRKTEGVDVRVFPLSPS